MKVLQINCLYNSGSTGKITADLHHALQECGVESAVLYGRMDKTEDAGVYRVCSDFYARCQKAVSMLTGIMYGGCFFSTRRIIASIKKLQPDIVHLQCINGNFVNIYTLLHWLARKQIKTVLTLHAEFLYTGGCGYALDCAQWQTQAGCGKPACPRWRQETKSLFFDKTAQMYRRMKAAIGSFDAKNLIVTTVSPWLMERAACSPILKGLRLYTVKNGVDTGTFSYTDGSLLRKQMALDGKPVVFYATLGLIGDQNHVKGGYYFLKLAEKMPDVAFVVAGSYEKTVRFPKNVTPLGRITDQKLLASYYSMADVTVLTSRRETFSMVVPESLCCGTPVAGFLAGGPESIALAEYTTFVRHGDLEALSQAVRTLLAQKIPKEQIAQAGEKVYSKNRMCQEYMRIYKELDEKQQNG